MKSDARPDVPEDRTNASKVLWSEVKAIFDAALEVAEPERPQFLDHRCAGNDELRHEVESLLDNHDETDEFLNRPIASVQKLLDSQDLTDESSQIGSRLGAYRLEKEIGRGGMGEVYLATRADSEFDKRVAIKLIRTGSEGAPAAFR